MQILQKWLKIVDWQRHSLSSELGTFAEPISDKDIREIENLIDESLPPEFLALYQYSNGEKTGGGLFFGGVFVDSNEIISSLTFSRDLIKPIERVISDQLKSKQILDKITQIYM